MTWSAALKPSTIHVPFRPMTSKEQPSPPVSLLARVDQEEYILLPNASALVSVCNGDLNRSDQHRIRIVAPVADNHGRGVIELEGLWLSAGGGLSRVGGSLLSKEYENEDAFGAENEQVGEKHRVGLHDLLENENPEDQQETNNEDAQDSINYTQLRRKILEVVTDSPGFITGKKGGGRTGGADGLLAGVMGWEYLLGEMFAVDHIGISIDGMCLTQECIGGVGQPAGIGDAFFRRSVFDTIPETLRMSIKEINQGNSGPAGSVYFEHTWMFDAYVPDVMVSFC